MTTSKVQIIQSAYEKIKTHSGYSQIELVKKLEVLGFKTTKSPFNKVVNNNAIGDKALTTIFNGMTALIKRELCLEYAENGEWVALENCIPETIKTKTASQNDITFHTQGRLDIADKVNFFSTAQSEMIEFGTTLNTFSNYFATKREPLFIKPILDMLERGVHIKCYLLDPDWNGIGLYFEERNYELEAGLAGIEKIKAALRKFKSFHNEIAPKNYSGKFEVFTYRHFPHNYFCAIDVNDKSAAKMMTSNYLFGLKRAVCPVLEFSRSEQPILFMRYLESLQKLIKDAKRVDFETLRF